MTPPFPLSSTETSIRLACHDFGRRFAKGQICFPASEELLSKLAADLGISQLLFTKRLTIPADLSAADEQSSNLNSALFITDGAAKQSVLLPLHIFDGLRYYRAGETEALLQHANFLISLTQEYLVTGVRDGFHLQVEKIEVSPASMALINIRKFGAMLRQHHFQRRPF